MGEAHGVGMASLKVIRGETEEAGVPMPAMETPGRVMGTEGGGAAVAMARTLIEIWAVEEQMTLVEALPGEKEMEGMRGEIRVVEEEMAQGEPMETASETWEIGGVMEAAGVPTEATT